MPPTMHLNVNQVIDNKTLGKAFAVSGRGGMRRSLKTNSLVVVSDHTRGIYHDRWENGILQYTGMGLKGDQALGTQNRTLAESPTNGIKVHLFEVHISGKYEYRGEVFLAGKPYQETQIDDGGQPRKVWVFPLKPKEPLKIEAVSVVEISKQQERLARETKQLTDAELALRAKNALPRPASVPVASINYYRNPDVIEYAHRRAKGKCDLCSNAAPFVNRREKPFLEVHHIEWLSEGGTDTIDNAVALCPNCHRKMHIRDESNDRKKLKQAAQRELGS